MLAMSPVLEEDRTGSPWHTVLWPLVGPDLRYSLYVTLAPGLPSSSSGDFALSSPFPYLRHLLSFTLFTFTDLSPPSLFLVLTLVLFVFSVW